jgi:hypothetical protein
MVFISEGMQLRIPAGGLKIALDGSDPPPITVEVRLDTWQHWLRVAVANVDRANAAHVDLLAAHAASDDAAKGRVLHDEFQAAMVAMSSAAFALDAFYATVKDRIPPRPDLEAAWSKNRTSRAARISETLRRAFKISNTGAGVLRATVKELFKFRNWAVHPPARFREPIMHPDLAVGVEWRFIAFAAAGCTEATRATLSILSQCLQRPKPQHAELVEWTRFGTSVLEPILDDWKPRYGSVVPDGLSPTVESAGGSRGHRPHLQ